jgi:hypothetical protein
VGALGSFDENGLGEPSVIFSAPFFYMLYTGRNLQEDRDIGYAVSADGVNWKKMTISGLFGARNRFAWNSHVICDTTLMDNADGSISVWYGGGDVADPAENVHGQIGYFTFTAMPFRQDYDANDDFSGAGVAPESLLTGSYPPDGAPGAKSAWAGPLATLRMRPPSSGQELVVSGWAPYTLHQRAGLSGPLELKVTANDRLLASRRFTADEVFELRIPSDRLAAGQSGKGITVKLLTSHSFVPSSAFGGPDVRQLAIKISSIKLRPKIGKASSERPRDETQRALPPTP